MAKEKGVKTMKRHSFHRVSKLLQRMDGCVCWIEKEYGGV
jgi:hypothetical protein